MIANLYSGKRLCRFYKTMKWNYHKQTAEKENPRHFLCVFLNFNLIWLTHPFCPWRHHCHWWHHYPLSHGGKLYAFVCSCQKWGTENLYPLLNLTCARDALKRWWSPQSSLWGDTVYTHMINSGGSAKPSSQRHNQSPWNENLIFLYWKLLETL